jgi:hypothetical protein
MIDKERRGIFFAGIAVGIMLAAFFAAHARAADKVLILNDQEQAALRVILDSAVHAQGLTAISRNAFVLSDKLDAAPAPPQEPPK